MTVAEVSLKSDVLASLDTEPFALDKVFIRALQLNDVEMERVVE